MNVLHIINSSGLGGAETIVKEILANNKQHKCFCLFKDKNDLFGDFENQVYYGLNKKGFYKINIFLFFKLLKTIKKEKIDIIHVHLAVSLLYGIFVKIFKPSIFLIYHEHGEIYFNSKFGYFLKIFRNFINIFIAVSDTTKKVLTNSSNINESRIIVIYNFINPEKIGNPHNKIKDGDFFRIGFIGRLTKIKGPDIFIKSLPFLDFEYKAIVAGDGEMRLMCKDYVAKNNLKDKVSFLGYVKETRDIYNKIDLLVCSSFSESFGVVVVEAQASGVPVVAPNLPAIKEVVTNEQTGLLFKIGNSEDLASKINLIYHDNRLYQLIKNEAFKNSEKYSLKTFLNAITSVYENLLKNN